MREASHPQIKLTPPVELKAGVPYVFYPDWAKGTVGIDHVSESEWQRVNAGDLPGIAVLVQKDVTLTEIEDRYGHLALSSHEGIRDGDGD